MGKWKIMHSMDKVIKVDLYFFSSLCRSLPFILLYGSISTPLTNLLHNMKSLLFGLRNHRLCLCYNIFIEKLFQ